ncbi:rhomboid family intramembrane serine protease [Hymenobacter sp. 15J16-1T3B]|uniref:rhomboid family intramembrane serine protease n=1 Tax=Hymenobacter sp. 15J16-1T3B TaxID=2886941 RepID=UPI001D1061FD|nr:rhomboid family intramembrane serine protease [Hymenobacter sp. 15J16-1T3B]MCC3156090.1 rhomboid family intramembrane serine protease [Hymenobacter sp. 15J16-1T3B]
MSEPIAVSLLLIIVTVIISVYAWSHPELYERWIMSPYLVRKRRQWYRFVSSGFLHADVSHLFFNMVAFYSFAQVVELIFGSYFGEVLGAGLFLLLYLTGIIASDIPSYFKHRADYDYRSLGASGGVASVMFAAILFNPLGSIRVMFLPIDIPSFIFGILYLLYSYYQGRRMGDNVNHDAHLYGAIYGILFTLVAIPESALIFWRQISEKYL